MSCGPLPDILRRFTARRRAGLASPLVVAAVMTTVVPEVAAASPVTGTRAKPRPLRPAGEAPAVLSAKRADTPEAAMARQARATGRAEQGRENRPRQAQCVRNRTG